VDIILLYAKEADPCQGGQTVIVVQDTALARMSTALREPIDQGQFEYRVRDRDYFPNRHDSWYQIPCWRDFGRRPSLNLALPFARRFFVKNPSWEVKLAHSSNARSEAYFRDLEWHFNDDRWSYSHDWRPGDLLVLDNQATLHGRLPFILGDRRVLWRLQFALKKRPSYNRLLEVNRLF
jgi:alpha-ketoglutarate-dependent taurine dioxygenase